MLFGGGLATTLVALVILALGINVGVGACLDMQRRAFGLNLDLVSKYGIGALADPFALAGTHGMALILASDGAILASAGQCCEEDDGKHLAEILHRLLPDAGEHPQDTYLEGLWTIFQRSDLDNSTLVIAYGWRNIAEGVREHIAMDIMLTLPTLIMTWLLLISLKLRAFRPLLEWARRVYESEKLSRTLIDTAPVGLGLIAVESGLSLLRSPAMRAITERIAPHENALSAACVNLHKTHMFQSDKRRQEIVNEDLMFDTLDGARVVLSVSMVTARYQGSDVLVTAFTDVTAKRRVERQLRKARKAADMANAAKSAFLAAMSHEIRTPLNAILGNLELLAHSPLNNIQKDRLNTIRASSAGLLRIVGDVLDFSKIEAGELTLESLSFDAQEVAARALRIFAPIAQSKGLELVADLGDGVVLPMRGDPTRLGQIFHNLLSNAVKFTEKGGVVFTMSVDARHTMLTISVADTGIGMTPEQRSRLFRAFSQSDPTINRRFGGTGLGLALCSRLARAMGGALSVESSVGQGSRFTLRLPLSAAASAARIPRFPGQRVVLIAASDSWREGIVRCLRTWGVCVKAYAQPADLDPRMAAGAAAVILWGGRRPWPAHTENSLVEESAWVIDCREDGPAQPVKRSRVLTVSTYGLKAVAHALRHALQGAPLSRPEMRRPLLAKRLKVLVAEDCAVNRCLLKEQLWLLGCDAINVEDGERALRMLAGNTFDVLLTDLTMPGLDGYALREKACEHSPGLIVIAMTAHITAQERDRCLRLGFFRVLEKPLLMAKLGETLAEAAGVELHDMEASDGHGPLGASRAVEVIKPLFLQSCRSSLLVLREARQAGEAQRLLAELHKLRGMLDVYGMHRLSRQAAQAHGALSESAVVDAAVPMLEALEKSLDAITRRELP